MNMVVTFALLAMLGLAGPYGDQALAQQTSPASEMNLIRNGTFDWDKSAWATNPMGTGVATEYGRQGPGMQIWTEFSDNLGYIYQEIHPPTQAWAANLSLDFRFLPGYGAALGYFRARLATETSTIATLLDITPTNYPGEAWQSTGARSLSGAELAALNSAWSAGEHTYLVIELYAQSLQVNVDNVAFRVSGQMTYPALSGSIAYVGLDSGGYPVRVGRIDPDGAGDRTLWTHPSTVPQTNAILDVAWRPDAREVAFSSNHESLYSAFQSDVYAVRPDGRGLRRITNPPSKAKLDAGGYAMGSVSGSVYNNYGQVAMFMVYVEGAADAVSVDIDYFGDETGFTVPHVADLGAGLHYVVFTWSSGSQANCKEYAAAVVDVAPGQTANAGTLTFDGHCGTYDSRSISWRRDGSAIGVDVITPRRFLASGQAIGTDLFTAPLTADQPAWSPVDDRLLYRNWLIGGGGGIFLTSAGGGAGTRLVDDGGALWVTPTWLPDGSGFVYTQDDTLNEYMLSSGQSTTLTQFYNEYVFSPSVSPDGQYVVFERQTTGTPTQHDLWILNRGRPTEMLALTQDGRNSNPDWSLQEPATAYRIYVPYAYRRHRAQTTQTLTDLR